MKLVNLTPHDVVVLAEGRATHIPASGQVARVVERPVDTGYLPLDGLRVPLTLVESGHVEGLPPRTPGTLFIVSRPVALALQGQRPDLLVPDQFERDEQGRIIGCRAFAQFVYSENKLHLLRRLEALLRTRPFVGEDAEEFEILEELKKELGGE